MFSPNIVLTGVMLETYLSAGLKTKEKASFTANPTLLVVVSQTRVEMLLLGSFGSPEMLSKPHIR